MDLGRVKFFYKFLGASSFALCAAAFFFRFFATETLLQNKIGETKRDLPPSSFFQGKESYLSFGEAVLTLVMTPPRLHLPNLKGVLLYYGKNGRPDASADFSKLHFGMQGGKALFAALPEEKIYLIYDKKLSSPCKYTFSPENKETLLWFKGKADRMEAEIELVMCDEKGEVISEGDANSYFTLSEKELLRTGLTAWELGKWRVDGTILARQKARWMGVDRFLEKHGGEEFAGIVGKHRIDFDEGEEGYAVFVKAGDCLIWEEEKWKAVQPGSASREKPLLHIKKIEDKIMSLELWDIGGKGKIALNLIKMPDPFALQSVAKDFRFLGARTKTQVVFQINQERMIVKPNDWLLLTSEGWKKITSVDEIDAYVNRRLVGPLFIFEEIMKKEDRPILLGTIFNPGRTEMHPIEVSMLPSGSASEPQLLIPSSDKPLQESKMPIVTPIATY